MKLSTIGMAASAISGPFTNTTQDLPATLVDRSNAPSTVTQTITVDPSATTELSSNTPTDSSNRPSMHGMEKSKLPLIAYPIVTAPPTPSAQSTFEAVDKSAPTPTPTPTKTLVQRDNTPYDNPDLWTKIGTAYDYVQTPYPEVEPTAVCNAYWGGGGWDSYEIEGTNWDFGQMMWNGGGLEQQIFYCGGRIQHWKFEWLSNFSSPERALRVPKFHASFILGLGMWRCVESQLPGAGAPRETSGLTPCPYSR
ncbi:MAG: hypothetical protein M1820_002979 [Bogoriella megaspora]|nr:MAG: hypothetical protein M1820_002979 [Bogoriella megaspora]